MTRRVFCQDCGQQFIKNCKHCHITESMIQAVSNSDMQKLCQLECNCPDAIPDGSIIVLSVTCEGHICEFLSIHD